MIPIPILKKYQDELVSINDNLYQIKIEFVPFSDINKELKCKLMQEYHNDKKAQLGLELMQIPTKKRLEQYGICLYGGLDDQPDFSKDETNKEWFNCGKRGSCPGEGLVCKSIKTILGYISPRQIQYLEFAVKGLTDMQIAEEMGVSHATICSHRVHCQQVLKLDNKVALVAWAKSKNIG